MTFNLAGDCSEKVTAQYLSPDSTRKALVIVMDCGTTTDYNTSVVIRNANADVRLSDDHVFSVKGLNNIEVVWEAVWSPKRPNYTIVYDPPKDVFRQAIVWQHEKISYRERARQ